MSSNSSSTLSPHAQAQMHLHRDGNSVTQPTTTTTQPAAARKRGTRFPAAMQSIIQRGKALLTPSGSNQSLNKSSFTTVKDATALFPATDPAVDGEDCLHDCASCTVTLPRKWSIDEDDTLFGHVNGWETHVIVATGKTDWVRDVTDEKGSLMERIGDVASGGKYNGRSVMLSASDFPTGNDHDADAYLPGGTTRCIVLPSWKLVEGVSTTDVEWMMKEVVAKGASNVQTIKKEDIHRPDPAADGDGLTISPLKIQDTTTGTPALLSPESIPRALTVPPPPSVSLRHCPHRALILMCSHKTRDWRCGASAPLLRKEFERHLRPLGLYRDVHDERPGGVGVYFINHVGGHKYSANVMVYRREGRSQELTDEAVQGIWLARVRPEDCENIVKYTVLQGRLVKPRRQLRGGFDREAGLVSW